jgi:hypothetical protein
MAGEIALRVPGLFAPGGRAVRVPHGRYSPPNRDLPFSLFAIPGILAR